VPACQLSLPPNLPSSAPRRHPSPPHATRMAACSPATLSHRVGCGALWRPVTAARLCLLSSLAAPVGFWSRPLDDEVLEQATLVAKLPPPNVCHGRHHLALPTRTRSCVGRVRWHPPSCRVTRLGSDAPSASPPPAAKGQHSACVAST
jgi:hypothetical protein